VKYSFKVGMARRMDSVKTFKSRNHASIMRTPPGNTHWREKLEDLSMLSSWGWGLGVRRPHGEASDVSPRRPTGRPNRAETGTVDRGRHPAVSKGMTKGWALGPQEGA